MASIRNLGSYSQLSAAVKSFIDSNSNFESSVPVDSAIAEISNMTDLMSVFALPLQHRLFSFDTALRWVLFLSVAPEKAVTLGDEQFSPHCQFSAEGALSIITQVFDRGIQDCVYDHFDEEEDDEDDMQ